MTEQELEVIVRKLLDGFYSKRLGKLSKITLSVICRKNPYLFKAIGLNKASEIVESVLQAFLSSSEETVFGNDFFEPLTMAVCTLKGGHKSGVKGIDIEIPSPNKHTAIAVKSATNSQNSDAQAKQNDLFVSMQRTLRTSGGLAGREYDAVLAYCYGRATAAPTGTIYRRVAGQAFGEELTGDSTFYLKILAAMGDYPSIHRRQYDIERAGLSNRLEMEFLLNFTVNGVVDWPKFLVFNSSKDKPVPLKRIRISPDTQEPVVESVPLSETKIASESSSDVEEE